MRLMRPLQLKRRKTNPITMQKNPKNAKKNQNVESISNRLLKIFWHLAKSKNKDNLEICRGPVVKVQ